jgi:hypothetical protein
MAYPIPVDMGQLASIVVRMSADLKQTRHWMDDAGGRAAGNLITGAREYAEIGNPGLAGDLTVDALNAAADSLRQAEARLKEVAYMVKEASQAASEAAARQAAKVAAGSKLRG